MKKIQIDRLIGFMVTLVVPAVVAWKLGEHILEDSVRKQAAINTVVVEAMVIFIIFRLGVLAGNFKGRRKSS
jgi:hypothetical protein